jgi:hypothetical protein
MKHKRFWETAAIVLFFLAIFFFSVNPYKESDSFYHLKAGQVIWETHTIPRADIFSYTAPGAPWIVHEWLAEVIFYLVFSWFGFWGGMFFAALLSLLTFYCMYKTAVLRGAGSNTALLIFIIAGLLTFELWIGRPQIFSFFFLALLIYLLERYRQSRMNAEEQYARMSADEIPRRQYLILAAIIALLVLWANMHASVILGLAVLILYSGIDFVKIFSSRDRRTASPELNRGEEDRRGVWLLGAAGLGIFACLLNPQGYGIFFYGSYIGNTIQALQVTEWLPITAFFSLIQTKAFLAVMIMVDGMIFWWFGAKKSTRDYQVLLLLLGVSILPFISIRHVGYFPIVALPFFASALSEFFNSRIKTIPEPISRKFWTVLAVFFFLASLSRLPQRYFNDQTVPVYAADFMEREKIPGPLFNLYNEGGYYIFRGWKVFIDGRSEVYGPKQISELFDIVNASTSFDALVNEKYSIDVFALAYRPQVLSDAIRPLVIKLFQEQWRLVWWDDAALIYVRDTPANAAVIQKYALYHVNPFRSPGSIPNAELPGTLKELKILLERSPANTVVQDYAASLLPSAYFKHAPTP